MWNYVTDLCNLENVHTVFKGKIDFLFKTLIINNDVQKFYKCHNFWKILAINCRFMIIKLKLYLIVLNCIVVVRSRPATTHSSNMRSEPPPLRPKFFFLILHIVYTYHICLPTISYTPNPILHSTIGLGVCEKSFPCILIQGVSEINTIELYCVDFPN